MPRPVIVLIIVLVVVGFLARDSAFMHSVFVLTGAIGTLAWALASLPFRLAWIAIQAGLHFVGIGL